MFNKRRRSYRKGPPANQIYVPRDQRKLQQTPIPIMTEKEAQYYYKQLSDMGYIPRSIPIPIYGFKIALIDTTRILAFRISYQSHRIYDKQFNASHVTCADLNDDPLDITTNDLVNKINENGYIMFPLIAQGDLRLYNNSSTVQYVRQDDLDNFTNTSANVGGKQKFSITNFSTAFVGAIPYYNYFMVFNNDTTATGKDIYYANPEHFYLQCDVLTVMCLPVS